MNITKLLPILEYCIVVTTFMVTNVTVTTPEYAQLRFDRWKKLLGGGARNGVTIPDGGVQGVTK